MWALNKLGFSKLLITTLYCFLAKIKLLFMNAGNKITIKYVRLDDAGLPTVIYGAIGNPSKDKVLEVIESYKRLDHEIIGAFIGDILVGALGICKASEVITIRHISVLENFQKLGIGALLLKEIKKRYGRCNIIAETDEESVDFYAKSCFTCQKFNGKHGNLRYKCKFLNEF